MIHLHSRPDQLDQALFEALPPSHEDQGAAIVTGEEHLLLADLVDDAWAASSQGRVARLGVAGESLLLMAVAGTAAPPLGALPTLPGLRRSLGGIFHAAGVAGLSPALLTRLAERLDGGTGRLLEMVRLYGDYRALLGSRMADEATVWRRSVVHLARACPSSLLRAEAIQVHGLDLCADEGPGRHGRLLLLSALCGGDPERMLLSRRGRESEPPAAAGPQRPPVRVLLPEVSGHPALEAALSPLQEALYRFHDFNLEEARIPLGPAAESSDPWRRFVRGLFAPSTSPPWVAQGEVPPSQLSLTCAPSPGAEARGVARAVRDLIDGGVPPAQIGLVAQSSATRARLTAALRQYAVPLCQAGGGAPGAPLDAASSVALAPPVQAVLALYDLAERGVPREALIQLLSSSYLRWSGGPARLPPFRVARALRQAGVRDLTGVGSEPGAEEADYRRRLREWARQQAAERRDPAGRPHALDGAVVGAIEAALGLLDTLPGEASVAVHATALRRLCDRLHLAERASGSSGASFGSAGNEVTSLLAELRQCTEDSAAISRDQEAVEALFQVLSEWPAAARRLGQSLFHERISRARFAQLLLDALRRIPLRERGVVGGAVVVGDLQTLSRRPFAHLFITGLSDGELPARGAEDTLLSDEERRVLNRALGQDVFPLSQGSDVLAPLLFTQVLAHSQAAHLSYPAADEQGRPLLRSPFVDEVLRAAARGEPGRERHLIIPPQNEARSPAELWTRAMLDRRPGPGPGQGPAASPLLYALSRMEPRRAERLLAITSIEEARLRWFAAAGAAQQAAVLMDRPGEGGFVGRLLDPELRTRLSVRLPGSTDHPLSASALEDYAKCPFRFFVRRVLKAEPIQEGGDDLDPLAGGRLHHEVLEKFFKARQEADRLPLRGDADDLAALDQTIEEVLSGWPQRERMGHKDVFAVRVRRLREDLRHLIEREAKKPVAPGCVPRLFEHRFGPLAISSPSEHEGGMPLHIFGIIDRVDVGGGRAVVLDYKAGRLDRYESILRHDLLTTSFQLPLYAAALKADPSLPEQGIHVDQVAARYYSLRSGRATSGQLDDQQMISLDPQVQAQAPEGNVAEVAYRLWRRLRDGDFRVAPLTCEGCGLEGACRVTLVDLPEEEAEGEGNGKAGGAA